MNRLPVTLFCCLLLSVPCHEGNGAGSGMENVAIPGNWLEIDNPENLEIWSMALDPEVGVWIGHNDGVAYYDGMDWTVYRQPESMSQGPVIGLHVDPAGSVVLLNGAGLVRFAAGRWDLLKAATTATFHSANGAIYATRAGEVWAGHDHGMMRLRRDGTVENVEMGKPVLALTEDDQRRLWWVTGPGREVYRAWARPDEPFPQASSWEIMLPAAAEPVRTACLLRDASGRIWLGNNVHDDRSRYFDPEREAWMEVVLPSGAGTHQAYDLAEDAEGWIWSCGEGSLKAIRGERVEFLEFPAVPVALVRSFLDVSSDGYLWVAEKSGRLFRVAKGGRVWSRLQGLHYQCELLGRRWFINEENQIVYQWLDRPEAEPEIVPRRNLLDHPVALRGTRDGRLWAIGSDRKAATVSIYDGEAWTTHRFPDFATTFDYAAFAETGNGSVLLGSGQQQDWFPSLQGGALRLHWREGALVEEKLESGLIPYRVHGIVELRPGHELLAGIRLIERRDDAWTDLQEIMGYPTGWIAGLSANPSGAVWGATYGRGVFRYQDGAFTWFLPRVGGFEDISVVTVAALGTDEALALTSDSLYRFSRGQWRRSVRLPLEHPLPRRAGSLLVGPDGSLWINLAHPYWFTKSIQQNRYHARMTPGFAAYRFYFDREAPKTIIRPAPEREEGLRSFSVDLDGRDAWSRTPRSALQFSYRIDGGAWSAFSNHREMDFQQLNEGRHVVEARARDLDFNIDPHGATIAFEIDIPFWQEGWFLPAVITAVFLCVVVLGSTMVLHTRNLMELEQQKLSFFTKLSHEIRTPLALILAPLEQARQRDLPAAVRGYLEQAQRSAGELKSTIDQLLDFRRAQSGVMRLNLERIDLVQFASDLTESFRIEAERRDQHLDLAADRPSFLCRADVDKLRGIFNNLLLNALRYSPNGARIAFRLVCPTAGVTAACFSVEDEGIGMSPDLIKVAFRPFTRGNDTRTVAVRGTGIGLAYVHELVRICGGRIEIVSPVDPDRKDRPGTRVTVEIPLEAVTELPPETDPEDSADTSREAGEGKHEQPLLLVVEDDEDMQRFLSSELGVRYRVLVAENGEAGLALAIQEVPDVIVCDRWMPVMDGLDFTRRIRANLTTSHIPVLMLSAAGSPEKALEGLRAGVNEYVSKPFSVEALLAHLDNQLAVRDGLRARMKAEFERTRVTSGETSFEDPFLNRVTEVIERHLEDYLFDADALSRALHVSRTSLYRKLAAIAGVSPSSMIKLRRLTRAARLLVETEEPVSIVMERVGIMDKRTFNKWFKDHFHSTPTEYRKTHWGRTAPE